MSQNQNNVDLPLPIEDINQESMVSLWWTSTLLKKISRQFFAVHDTSEAQFNMLYTIGRLKRNVTQKELSEILLVDKSNITGLIDRAEKDGLIARQAVKGDRRSYHIVLTPVGKKMLDRVGGLYEEVVAKVMADFSEKQKNELIGLMRKMREAMDKLEF